MIQLKIASGSMAGAVHAVRHFPFQVGRSPRADLRLQEPGVFDEHLSLDFDPTQGFVLSALGNAIATVNGWPIQSVLLRNGDSIELGALKIRFWIGEVKQSEMRAQEYFTWAAIAAITLAQIALIFAFLH